MFKVTITAKGDAPVRLLFHSEANIIDITGYFIDHPLDGKVSIEEITDADAYQLDLERTKEEVERAMALLDQVYPTYPF